MVKTAIDVHVIESEDELKQAFDIRTQVFVGEQSVTEAEEFDGLDNDCTHYIAKVANVVAGTLRIRPLKNHEEGDVKIERICVAQAFRGHGVGRKIVEKVLNDLKNQGYKNIVLYGQTHALGFYQSFGFKPYGDEFLDARIPHRKLKLQF
jgi:predicted GNAT family N-acyltransferase